MMSRNEYLSRLSANDGWAPGWEALEEPFERLYPGVEPPYLATEMTARTGFGGNAHLDGLSLYPSPHGYFHLLSYGLTDLYGSPESYGGLRSGLGYEMTMKVVAIEPQECLWAAQSMQNLARYSIEQQRPLAPFQVIDGGGRPLDGRPETALTSYLTVPDTEVDGVDSVHGRIEYVQLGGITQQEVEWVSENVEQVTSRAHELADRMRADDPVLITDLTRTTSYVG